MPPRTRWAARVTQFWRVPPLRMVKQLRSLYEWVRRGENVTAFVILRSEFKGRITEADLISWAKEKRAAYRPPRILELVEDLPRTASGKIPKRVLGEREKGQAWDPFIHRRLS